MRCELVLWVYALASLAAIAAAAGGAPGSSLRGALEALQRRQRGSQRIPLSQAQLEESNPVEYDDNYVDYIDGPYQENDDLVNVVLDNNFDPPGEGDLIEFLPNNDTPKTTTNHQKTAFRERLESDRDALPTKINKSKRSSAFRERSNGFDQDVKEINDMFINKVLENGNWKHDAQEENDKEYAELLSELWKKYSHKFPEVNSPSDQVIWLYKNNKNNIHRSPEMHTPNKVWGPMTFKKRNTLQNNDLATEIDLSFLKQLREEIPYENKIDLDYDKIFDMNVMPPYDHSISNNPDVLEEIGIAFKPLDNENQEYLQNNNPNHYWLNSNKQKRFPVTKRSSGDSSSSSEDNKISNFYKIRMARGGFGTNSKVLKDLSAIFGNMESMPKLNVKKRSEPGGESYHEQSKSPQVSALSHNNSHNDANSTIDFIDETDKNNNHQHAPHAYKHSTDSPSETMDINRKKRQNASNEKKALLGKKNKKAFKWSNYFGIDKRQKKPISITQDVLKKNFLNMFKTKIITQTDRSENKDDSNAAFDWGHSTEIDEKKVSTNNLKIDKILHPSHLFMTPTAPLETNLQKSTNTKQQLNPFKNMDAITIDKALQYGNDRDQEYEFTNELTFDDKQNKYKREIKDINSYLPQNPITQIVQFNPEITKRSQSSPKKEEIDDIKLDRATILSIAEKREPKRLDNMKLENMDNKLKNLEIDAVKDATNLGEHSDGLDSKEEQEVKERILSRLAAAYSLEKMRKALREFKHSLELQKNSKASVYHLQDKQIKEKKVPQEKNMSLNINHNDIGKDSEKSLGNMDTVLDKYFEAEQGAGQFSNGKIPYSEGYMGGSGRKNEPIYNDGADKGNCPSLDMIVKKCRRIDILAGDHLQLFLPLCSLHQICYLCGTLSETGCDLIFISEADALCYNKTDCLQAARNTIMLLRELHESMADDLEGECDNNPCLKSALQYNPNWWSRE